MVGVRRAKMFAWDKAIVQGDIPLMDIDEAICVLAACITLISVKALSSKFFMDHYRVVCAARHCY